MSFLFLGVPTHPVTPRGMRGVATIVHVLNGSVDDRTAAHKRVRVRIEVYIVQSSAQVEQGQMRLNEEWDKEK